MALYVITVAWALRARLIEQGQGALPLLLFSQALVVALHVVTLA